MAKDIQGDIFHAIRATVGQTLEMAEAETKVSAETRDMLAQLVLTRRGDGEIVLDVAALQRMKAQDNQWVDKKRSDQDRFVNPTRLPQLIPGLSGLTPSQYLAFVQRPLERNGDNSTFLKAQTLRLYDEYSEKEKLPERNKLFGHMQRYVAKLLIDELLVAEHKTQEQDKIDELRNSMAAAQQFELAAKALDIQATDVVNRLFKYGVALTLIERIKNKARQIKKAQPKFEVTLRKIANTDIGPTAKTRIKEIFLGFQKELEVMTKEYVQLNKFMTPVVPKLHKDSFEKEFSLLHIYAARLDAIASRWVIIFNEANNALTSASVVEKVKGMHKVYSS